MQSEYSSRLGLAFLAPAQTQKHVTVNEALLRLDALVQASAVSRTIEMQPSSPTDGDVYILPATKSGAAWGGMAAQALAYYRDGAWEQITPKAGFLIWVNDESAHFVFKAGAWSKLVP